MERERTFEVGGARHTLIFTCRALRSLEREHGVNRDTVVAAVSSWDLQPQMMLAGLNAAHRRGLDGRDGPWTFGQVEDLLDEMPASDVERVLDEAVCLGAFGRDPDELDAERPEDPKDAAGPTPEA